MPPPHHDDYFDDEMPPPHEGDYFDDEMPPPHHDDYFDDEMPPPHEGDYFDDDYEEYLEEDFMLQDEIDYLNEDFNDDKWNDIKKRGDNTYSDMVERQERERKERMGDVREKFEPDMNMDGVVDEFEYELEKCLIRSSLDFFECHDFAEEKMEDKWEMMDPEMMMEEMEGDEDFFDEFDPDFFNDIELDKLEDFDPRFIENVFDHNPEFIKSISPEVLKAMPDEFVKEFDPLMFDHMKHMAEHFDPRDFEEMDEEFFDEFDPDFLNYVDIDEIPIGILDDLEFDEFDELDPALYEFLEEYAPEKLGDLDEEVIQEMQFMMDDIPEEVFDDYKFEEGEEKEIKELIRLINKYDRKDIIHMMDKMDDGLRGELIGHHEDLEGEAADFFELVSDVEDDDLDEFMAQKEEFFDHIDEYEGMEIEFAEEIAMELEQFMHEVADFNFYGDVAEDFSKRVDEFVGVLDVLDEEAVEYTLDELYEDLDRARADSRIDKYEAGLAKFKDADDNAWYYNFVDDAVDAGVVSGYKDEDGNMLGEFRPANPVVVAESMKMLLEDVGHGKTEGDTFMEDIDNHWAKEYVKTAEQKGYNFGEDINRQATRAEVAKWVFDVYEITPPDVKESTFKDVSDNNKYLDYIEYAKDLGILTGDDGLGTLRPEESISRCEILAVMKRAKNAFWLKK